MSRRVRVDELIDPAELSRDGRPPTPAQLRAALPPGWVLEDDNQHARRDLRLLFRRGWILALALLCFGAAGIGLFWSTFPRGWSGVARALGLLAALLLIGGLIAPAITRALHRR
ncbi:MAG TPA: hypothetical protein VMS76_14535 [Planctomycetota bacterium]|nr:hypothetical protein [Planctomycetota bacterium]